MTPEDQRIAIATWMGWTQIEDKSEPLMMPKGSIVVGYPPKNQIIGKKQALPDYLNDLNEMFKVEEVLEQRFQVVEYGIEVLKVIEQTKKITVGGQPNWGQLIHATAAQRAEALLRVIGRWTE